MNVWIDILIKFATNIKSTLAKIIDVINVCKRLLFSAKNRVCKRLLFVQRLLKITNVDWVQLEWIIYEHYLEFVFVILHSAVTAVAQV